MKYIKASKMSYGSKRKRSSVKYIVIHYTGVKGDTALNEANYFARNNTRFAGAHFFVDQQGNAIKSIPLNRTAWSVGGFYSNANGAGKYYKKCTNSNSVSIELCDNVNRDPSTKQIKAVKRVVKYIRRYCKNAQVIIRHWDVNGKCCPARMVGTDNAKWKKFKKKINVG